MKTFKNLIDEKEELTEAGKSFMRLPDNVINNELFIAQHNLTSFLKTQTNGNDFDLKSFKEIIKSLQNILKEAKKFNSEDEVPLSYRYKGK